jgi:uncharacterized protein (DUF1330 family)
MISLIGSLSAIIVPHSYENRYIKSVMGGNPELLEGEWNPEWRIVISEWQSRAQALAFWRSPEYAAIKPLREGIAEATVILLDGLPLS